MYKKIILSKIRPYLKKHKYPFRAAGKVTMVKCIYCEKEPFSASVIPNTHKIKCLNCNKVFTLVDIYKKIEEDLPEEEILQNIKDQLNIDVSTKKDLDYVGQLLDFYQKNKFNLVPIAKGQKYPIEKNWQKKNHTDKEEWENWLNNKLNLGCKTGKISGVTVIDIDTKDYIHKDLINILPKDTLIQETKNGWHYFFKYDEELPKTRVDKYDIDIETDGGQVVIEPSITDNYKRKFINRNEIKEIPKELKELLLKEVTVPRKTASEKIVNDIKQETYRRPLVEEGQGRNEMFIRLGGMFRKFLSQEQTKDTLKTLDKVICDPPLGNELNRSVFKSIEKYRDLDQEELQHEILKYLQEVEVTTKSDLELAVKGNWTKGELKKNFNRVLRYLINTEKIKKKGREYHLVKRINWKDTFMDVGTPVDFKVPFFHDYANFNQGDLILIGGKMKTGKSTLSVNFLKRLIDQGIKPYYVYTESGGRFAKTGLELGLKEGDYFFSEEPIYDIEELKFEKNAVTVYDWVMPNDQEGFARLDVLFRKLVQKTEKAHGFTIAFMQLKENNRWFAPNLVPQFPALLARYMYRTDDGTETKFKVDYVRDGKMAGKTFDIPCEYDRDTKLVKTINEIKGE